MLYSKLMFEAMKLVIVDDYGSSGFSYLEPHYQALLEDAGLTPDKSEDRPIDWPRMSEILKLEVERRNRVVDKTRFVIDWVFNIIATTVDPQMVEEENALMKNIVDYLKFNSQLEDKERSLQDREATIEHKENVQEKRDNILQLVPGMNFSKRGSK